MYLKRLELQGFKSFAPRTVLEFSPGITAIVGPNGSGKSNIADAIRWVLGEQSMRQLRGKKSDDIIFAGGHGRAQMQMAEVGLVLENSSGWLPSEHTEVTAARRSFRSGESEYLVNGQRVRLRDLLLLLAQARIGHDSYTVIGQGLVDQALSLRAEERRGLFEDAAGIRQFQAQRTDAEQKLSLTQSNLARLHDILGEIEPRLGPLAEQAKRAREYSGARDDLKRLLKTWYAWQWREALTARDRANAAEAELAESMESIRAAQAEREEHARQTREARETIAAHIADLRKFRGEATGRVQALERDQAVGQERLASLVRQASDLEGEQGEQEAALAAALAHAEVLDEQVERVEEQSAELAARIETLERAQHTARQNQEREEAALRAAQRDAVQAQARLGAAQTELGRLQRQLGERNRTLAQRQEAVAAAQRRLEAARANLEEKQVTFEAARREVEGLVGQREELQREITSGQAEAEQARAAVADAQRERLALADRLALLEEWSHSLGGYSDGVRAVLNAPEADRPPVLGVLARMIRVSAGYEAAIEAALGPFLDSLVAASEADALACARWLRQHGAGRALIVWPDAETAPNVIPHVAQGHARAAQDLARAHVEIQPELTALLDHVLAGVELASDLDGAAGALGKRGADVAGGRLRAFATRGGDLLHAHHWLRVGAEHAAEQPDGADTSTDGTLLARERELRQLPAEIERRDAGIAELQARLDRLTLIQRERLERAAAVDQEAKRAEVRAQELAREVAALQRDEERAQSERQLSQTVADQLAAETAGVEQEVTATAGRVTELERAQQDAADHVRDVQETLDDLLAENRAQQDELAQQRTALAVQRQEAKALGQRAEQLRAQAKELSLQIERRADRVQAVTEQRAQLEQSATQLQDALALVRARLRELSDELREQEGVLAEHDRALAEIDREQGQFRQDMGIAEVEYRRRIVEAQRARDAVESLTAQVREELSELAEADDTAGGDAEVDPMRLLGDDSSGAADRLSPEEAAKLRRDIDRLRNRLRHLGGYDPEAPQAYEELKTRYEFLSAQVRDMEQAAANLRSVIAELDITMRRQFTETFQAVNLRFQRHFTTLFNGGSARLELTAPRRRSSDDEDDEEDADQPGAAPRPASFGGVEVFVQIPGKRVQDLSLLSGGERAMVSAALLFALLETNPPPFCLLDEVDAALDEANVVRFCEILKQLAERTQFVVITHNRVTMTHAGAIYGVSMASDSVSRVLSMRLADVRVPVR
ncbi:MAG TPA: chromosome segregation protein SMC [Ktedonobacterales bacterium]